MADQSAAHQAKSPQIYICGTGVRVPGHLTVETMGVLQGCNRIFSNLPAFMRQLLPPPLCDRYEDLWDIYRPAEMGLWANDHIINQVLDAALESAPVAYLTQGNPILFDPVTKELLSCGRERGVLIEVRPAISSIDTILVDLQLDVAPGIQIYDTSSLVMCEIQPRIDVPCLLIQPCAVVAGDPSADGLHVAMALRSLGNYLRRFYPAEHEVVFVTSADAIGGRPRLDRFQLEELGDAVDAASALGASLFVPAVRFHSPEQSLLDRLFEQGTFVKTERKNEFQA